MRISKEHKILIVGLGLIGGSYAQGLSRKGYQVGAIDISQSSIDFALANKYISSGQAEVNKDYVSNFDVIVFALYPSKMIEWIEQYQSLIKENAILTDVSGVKGSNVYKIQSILRSDLEFIAAHPMAGREVYGVENANANIFKGANYIVVPTKNNSEEAVELCKSIGEELEFKNISTLSVEEHDEMIGFLSQLTHCIAVTLMTSKKSEHLAEYTGDSFRDLTRIAKINENMWCELFLSNKDELIKQMEAFEKEFDKLKTAIKEDDEQTIKEMMVTSTQRRKIFDKWGKRYEHEF